MHRERESERHSERWRNAHRVRERETEKEKDAHRTMQTEEGRKRKTDIKTRGLVREIEGKP